METTWCVYIHTNKTNGFVYVGITNNVNRRWRNNGIEYKKSNHKYHGATPFYAAILKYGWDGFTHDILYSGLTLQEANAKEVELIAKYKSNISRYGADAKGYNLTDGGDGTKGTPRTEEEKRYLSECNSGCRNAMYGKHHTEETKAKISSKNKGRFIGEKSPLYGRIVSEETRRKLSESHRDTSGSNNPRARRVRCIELNIDFDCLKFAVEYFKNAPGITRQNIGKACAGKQETAGGFHWQYID